MDPLFPIKSTFGNKVLHRHRHVIVFKITLKSYDMRFKKIRNRPFFSMKIFNFAHFLPVFLLKKGPFFAHFFIIFSPFEEIATLEHPVFGATGRETNVVNLKSPLHAARIANV